MSRVSVKAVLIGAVIDVDAYFALGIPLGFYVMVHENLIQLPRDQVQAAVSSAIYGNTALDAVQLLIGLACSVIGGYVAAWIAKHDELLNGTLSAFLCVGIGIHGIIWGSTVPSMLRRIITLIASVVCALGGGYLRRAQKGLIK
jgi:hypothetical protein